MMRERGAGKVEFLAQREMILKDLTAGWPMKVVWRRLKNAGTMSIEYPQFRQYCQRFLGYPPKDMEKDKGGNEPQNPKAQNAGQATVSHSEVNDKDKQKDRTGQALRPRKFDWEGRKKTDEEIIG